MVVGVGGDTVQLEDVDIVGAKRLERMVEAGDQPLGSGARGSRRHPGLGGDHYLLARDDTERLAKHGFGAVDGGGVKQVDAQ
jgi:hypothetical protein